MKYKGVKYIGFWYSKLNLKVLLDFLYLSFNVLLWTNYFDNALLSINTESKGNKYLVFDNQVQKCQYYLKIFVERLGIFQRNWMLGFIS